MQRATGDALALAEDDEDEADAYPAGGKEEAVIQHRRQLAEQRGRAGVFDNVGHEADSVEKVMLAQRAAAIAAAKFVARVPRLPLK